MENKMKLSPPWIEHVSKLEALFRKDPQVHVQYNDEEKLVKLLVEDPVKAEALTKLVKPETDFGGVVLKVIVVPSNGKEDIGDLFMHAFAGNDTLIEIHKEVDFTGTAIFYALFSREVVSYYGDNIGDPGGNQNTLYQEIARDVLEPGPGVFFSTAKE